MPPEESAGKSLLENPHEDSAGNPLLEKLPEESAGKSLLEKPLHLLTEDDISQLTREDCRRYLKEKGMRRPSWNKSQAIQQVIMLKKLLEADSIAGSPKRHSISCCSNTAVIVPGGTNMDAEISVSEKRSMPHPVKDANKPDSSGVLSGCLAAANDESAQLSIMKVACTFEDDFLSFYRTIQTTNIAARQMTIFYGGKVNVYDDVPTDKARTILHIAASPLEFPEEQLNDGTILQSLPGFSKAVSTKARQDSAGVILPTLHTVTTRDNSLMIGEESIMLLDGTPVWKDHQPEKHQYKGILRRKRTGEGLRVRGRQEQHHVQAWMYTLTINWVIKYRESTDAPQCKPDRPQPLHGAVQWLMIQSMSE
ncbi:TIFY [Orobanche gracilis]